MFRECEYGARRVERGTQGAGRRAQGAGRRARGLDLKVRIQVLQRNPTLEPSSRIISSARMHDTHTLVCFEIEEIKVLGS